MRYRASGLCTMQRTHWRTWRVWALLIWAFLAPVLVTGCGSTGLPRDPMFVSLRPIEGTTTSSTPVAVAAIEPSPPAVPEELSSRPVYAQRRQSTSPDRVILSIRSAREVEIDFEPPAPRRTIPGVLTNRPISRDAILPEPKQP
jgi:hypothetical protein